MNNVILSDELESNSPATKRGVVSVCRTVAAALVSTSGLSWEEANTFVNSPSFQREVCADLVNYRYD